MKRALLFAALFMIANIVLAQVSTQPSVREILGLDGTLCLERNGSYSLNGYELCIDVSSTPRAVQKGNTQMHNTTKSTWNSVGTGVGGIDFPSVLALAVYNGELYVGGSFTEAGGISANNIARWNGTNWNSAGKGSSNGVNGAVNTLAVYNSELYVGGDFRKAGGNSANRIARWDGTNWNSVGTGADNGVSGGSDPFVRVLAVHNGELYVGGSFTAVGSMNASNIARWDGTSWNSVGTGSDNGVDNIVSAFAGYNSGFYIGGFFTQAGSVNASRIARWNGMSCSSIGSSTKHKGFACIGYSHKL